MKVSPEDVEKIILQVFSDLHIPPNGKLHHADLVRHWQQYRFRNNDLSQALASLIRTQAVITESTEDGIVLMLTQEGHARTPSAALDGIQSWGETMKLSWLFMSRAGAQHDGNRQSRARLRRGQRVSDHQANRATQA